MAETRAPDPLEDLISSALAPLRFLAEASEERRSHIRLPVQTWIARIAEIQDASQGASRRRKLAELAAALSRLGEAATADAGRLAAVALSSMEGLRRAGATSVPGAVVSAEDAGSAQVAPVEAPGPEVRAPARSAEPLPLAVAAGPARSGGRSELADVERWLATAASGTLAIPGVGAARAKELERFGLRSVDDVLYHLPFRYDDRRRIARVSDLVPGESATATLEIRRVDERPIGRSRRRSVLSVIAGDETGTVELVWFNQIRWFRGRLKPNAVWVVHGRPEPGYGMALRIVHPEIEAQEGRDSESELRRIVPVYEKPLPMPVATMRRIAHAAVDAFAARVPDSVPAAVRERHRLLPLAEALAQVHRPGPEADAAALGAVRSDAHRAIVFDELFFVQLGLLLRKAAVAREPGTAFAGSGDLVERMIASLPYPLTGAQARVIAEIAADQSAPRPMHRLLQGDVGSGKTVVAVAAALRVVELGWQAAIMAPTELLAEQHWETVQRVAGGLGVSLWLLTGEASAAERRSIAERLAAGEPGIVVGTHALIQEGVQLARLGLAVVDEQHRFGVLQRAALSRRNADGTTPDVLLMTATPIPRTLALSVYGDLDLSYLDEMPPGRKPITTRLFPSSQRARAYDLIRREVAAGRQAYIVYPMIEESEASDLRDATSAAEELSRDVFPDFRIGLVHGRIPALERDAIMRAFKAGEYHVLVATTVIEVGIDVPNASVIAIEHAERFGLAQLHQLRGRVGRGSDAAHCFLLADWAQSKEARERLRVMTETRDGLRIAEADLAIRGPGAMLGTRQAGLPDFRVANLLRDVAILREAREAAAEVLERDPTLSRPESAVLARVLDARWAGRLGLARVG